MLRTNIIEVFLILLFKMCGCWELNGTNEESWKCRSERGELLPLNEYRRDTCARCYFYLPPFAFKGYRFRYDFLSSLLVDDRTNTSFEADPDNLTLVVYSTFSSTLYAKKWIDCCSAALECCADMLEVPPISANVPVCPRTWDGWQCWGDTPAGQVAKVQCQEHVYFMSSFPPCPRWAHKRCMVNGSWYVNQWDSEWTNYSSCGRTEDMRRLMHFHIVTYAISIVFLLPAIFIFILYKQLQVYRITMHKNLFAALLFHALSAILFRSLAVLEQLDPLPHPEITLLEENGVWCKALCLLTKYTRMTTYMWMFCEGFYLHKLIASSFAEQKSLRLYYFVGWIFPIFPIATFGGLRWYFADEECWAIPIQPYEWVTNSPNLLSLVLNFVFLCNIIRVLVTKLRAAHTNEPSQFRKAVRATLVLVPLFGLHFFFVLYRPQSGQQCSTLEGYAYFAYTMDGLQGFLVALIFCYLNGEIQGLVSRSIQRLRLQRSMTSSSEWRRSTRSEPVPKIAVVGRGKRGAVRPFLYVEQ